MLSPLAVEALTNALRDPTAAEEVIRALNRLEAIEAMLKASTRKPRATRTPAVSGHIAPSSTS
jgi:hypothetical protein